MKDMNSTPLVSIVCDTYNHELYIRQCLDGFIMQKTDFLFEVLIHDDASTDGTADIIREYETKYPDIVKPIYQTENQYSKKISIWRTYQFSRVKGKYIAMCEGDDYWIDPNKLQKQVDFLETHEGFSLCCHNAFVLAMRSTKVSLFMLKPPKILSVEDILKGWFIPSASMVFRSEIAKNLPDWFTNIYNGDYALHLMCALKGSVSYLDDIMSVYRFSVSGGCSVTYEKNVSFIKQKFFFLLDMFDKESNYIYNKQIDELKKKRNKYYRDRRLWQKGKLLYFLLKPWKLFMAIRQKYMVNVSIINNYF